MGSSMNISQCRPASRFIALVFIGINWLLVGSNSQAASPPAKPAGAHSVAAETPEELQVRIAKLIEQLGDKQYLVRQAAQDELNRIGPDAFDALSQAENNSDIEICSRAKYLVQQIRIEFVSESDSPQIKQILRDYDRQDDDRRLQKMQELAMLPRDLGLPALCRLVRFEKSPLLSKHGALLILGLPVVSASRTAAQGRSIEINLASCTRPAAKWLRAYVQFCRDPKQGAAAWDNFVNDELAAVESTSEWDSDSVLLLEQRFGRFFEQKLHRHDLAVELMHRMLALESGDPVSLKSLVDWYVQCQAWDLIDEAAKRFDHVFTSDPLLMYTAAHAKQAQHQNKEADELAEKAIQLVPQQLEQHVEMARVLMQHGLFEYCEREYRYVIEKAPPETKAAINSQMRLAEMLHDQEHELAAADVIHSLVSLMDSDEKVKQQILNDSDELFVPAARMHFFYACDAAAHHQLDEQRKHLDQAIVHDPKDADVLIALFETSRDDPVRRKRALALIHDADEKFRADIAQQPNNFVLYNMVAWLLGNTVGDFDQAVQYSQKSIALAGTEEGGFIDTLAHCYAGGGDYESAVKYQIRAQELDPHTLQITRALEQFTAQLEKKRQDAP
jgi:tetratricopeptide (TPR) repeat protein